LSAFALALAACGGGGGGDNSQQPQPSPLPTPPTIPPLATGVKPQLIFGGTIGTKKQWSDGDTSTGGQGDPVDGIACGNAVETYHVHAHVSIFLNGDQLIFPKLVGIPTTNGVEKCHYIIHTHDETGEIHVEAPAAGTFTLGQLFDIWGQPLNTTTPNVGGIQDLPIAIYIVEDNDTAAKQYTDDPKNIELSKHRQITIQVGTAISAIPVYDFAGA